MDDYFSQLHDATIDMSKRTMTTKKVTETGENLIYIRDCYDAMLQIVREVAVNGHEHMVVTGTPGIGKSLFAHYATKRLVDEGNVIILIHQTWEQTHLFLPAAVSPEIRELLTEHQVPIPNQSTWAGQLPERSRLYASLIRCKDVVIILDPSREFRKFSLPLCGSLTVVSLGTWLDLRLGTRDSVARLLYLPLWNDEELVTLLTSRRPQNSPLPQDELELLQGRIAKYGYVPRRVARAQSHDKMVAYADVRIAGALSLLASDKAAAALDPQCTDPTINGVLVHMNTSMPHFSSMKLQFASDQIKAQVIRQLYKHNKLKLLSMMESSYGINDFATFCGKMYENLWNNSLQTGGTFQLQELLRNGGRGPIQHMTLPETKWISAFTQNLRDVSNMEPLAGEAGTFLTFVKPNVPTFDFIITLPLDAVPMFKLSRFFSGEPPTTTTTTTTTTSSSSSSSSFSSSKKARLDTRPRYVGFGGQDTVDVNHGNAAIGHINAIEALQRSCPGADFSLEYVLITNEDKFNDFKWTEPTGRFAKDERIQYVRQWVLKVPNERLKDFDRALQSSNIVDASADGGGVASAAVIDPHTQVKKRQKKR